MSSKTRSPSPVSLALALTLGLSGLHAPLSAAETGAENDETPDGATIYHDYCSVCHGDRGDGQSRARGSFFPPPRDFTVPKAREELTRNRMVFSVSYGRPNTAMAGWGKRLSEAEVAAVVDFIRINFMKMDPEVVAQERGENGSDDRYQSIEGGKFDPEFMGQPMPFGLAGNVEWGRLFYDENCAVCHGVDGDGKGPRAYFILPKPRDYRHPAARHKLNRPTLFDAVAKGSLGSEMPAWDKVLTYQEIAHVTEYIFQAFIKTDEMK